MQLRLITASKIIMSPATATVPITAMALQPHLPVPAPSTAPQSESATSLTSPRLPDYLPIDEVDQPAEPLGDWAINANAIPPDKHLRLVLRLWVSASGSIDKWELADDAGQPQLAQKILMSLDQTPFQPALLRQMPVPSFRQLEMLVTHE